MNDEDIGKLIVDRALRVHSALGCGLLENVYEACLAHELLKAGLSVQKQVSLPVQYDGVKLDVGYRLDLLIEEKVIVEVKAVERMLPVHTAQLITYLKLSNLRLGFLLNFNVPRMRDGIKRVVNGFQ